MIFENLNNYLNQEKLLLCIPFFPLVGCLLTYLLGGWHRRLHFLSGILATGFSFFSFLFSVIIFIQYRQLLLENPNKVFEVQVWNWIEVGLIQAQIAFRFDGLAAVMTLIVSGVGTLIHLYAIGYMAEDESQPRFFAYLNLFLFSMLILVLADNLLLMFVGWEGVGLCSYLLIGFWFKDMANAKAGQKAFVVNRIGDTGFILAISLLSLKVGSLNYVSLQDSVSMLTPNILELAAILLFIGAIGKSAQIPLFVWLPDAMAGPTPVSALIHAATMVTAGVYMVCRMSFLYCLAPYTLLIIGVIGGITAFFAAAVALTQYDIKKMLAYSTISQLGYMFMALGAGAFSNGIYHVVTHAFFKACLFLAAGCVILRCHHEQDMRKLGGLYKKMPYTFVTYLIAALALAGIPFTSGFYSKDAILWTVFSNQGLASKIMFMGVSVAQILWVIGIFTAFLTALYITRSLVMTFLGSYRGKHLPSEAPIVMILPLLLLASLSAAYGYLWGDSLLYFLRPWTRADLQIGHHLLATNVLYQTLEVFSGEVAILGMIISLILYLFRQNILEKLTQNFFSFHRFFANKCYIDEFYDLIIIKPIRFIAEAIFKVFDRCLIDGSIDLSAFTVQMTGESVRKFQTGKTSFYLIVMFCGNLALVTFVLWFVNFRN